mgnify:CR=1 FL=1
MSPELALDLYIRPALSILPDTMNSLQAQAMLIAIGLQESRFSHREQVGGPAKGYCQFEPRYLELFDGIPGGAPWRAVV